MKQLKNLPKLAASFLLSISFIGFYSCQNNTSVAVNGEQDTTTLVASETETKEAPPKEEVQAVVETEKWYYGIDVSRWNGNEVEEIDPSDSISFIICKASQGITSVDPKFKKNFNTIKQKGAISGTYHFYIVKDDPLLQANHFYSTVSAAGKPDMPYIVDIEQGSLPSKGNVNKDQIQKDLLVFLNTIEEKCACTPMIYTGEAFGSQYLNNPVFAKYPLWLAEYTRAKQPKIPATWKKQGYKIWQKSENYTIKSTQTDFDVFYGKKSDLYK